MRRSSTPRAAYAGGLVLVLAALTGCGEARVDTADDLCAQYAQLVERVDSLEGLDPDTATADEVRQQVEEVQDQLDALQAVAEGRLDTLISSLRTTVNDFAAAASQAGQDALETARPLLEDTLDDIREAWASLQSVADVRCEET